MIKFIVRRLLTAAPVLFGLSILLFVFIHLLPGDPATAVLGEHATPDRIAQMRAYLGLDQPLPVQYIRYLGGLLRGDLGSSVVNGQPVLTGYLSRFPATLELAAAAVVIAAGIAIPLGRFAGLHAQRWPDGVVTVVSLLGISIPVFVLGLALQVVFAVHLNWLPATGQLDPRINLSAHTGFVLIDVWLMADWSWAERFGAFVDGIRHLILPAVTLSSIPLAIITRVTRASVIEVSTEDYVRTARAKGLNQRRVDDRHIMRNAWLPVVTVIGLQVGALLGGAVLTERVFAWSGVGLWVVQAIEFRDYFVIQGTILVFAMIFVLVNLIVDVTYAFLNPAIRYG